MTAPLFQRRTIWISALLSLALLAALAFILYPRQTPDGSDIMEGFSCTQGKPGWKPASAVTPDVVYPCMTGSGGICPMRYQYVSGTGWCRSGG